MCIVDAIAFVQLAAVLHQVDVRVKDLGLYGIYWLHAARSQSFLEVGKLAFSNVKRVSQLVAVSHAIS